MRNRPSWMTGAGMALVLLFVGAWVRWGLPDREPARQDIVAPAARGVSEASSSRPDPAGILEAHESSRDRRSGYGYTPGQVLDYDVRVATSVVQHVGDASIPLRAVVRGTLRLSVCEEGRDGFALVVQLLSPRVEADGGNDSRGQSPAQKDGESLSGLICMDITRRGELRSLHLPGDVPPSLRNTLRGIVAPLAFVLPGDSELRWSTEQEDTMGRFLGSYLLDGSQVSMQKKYLAAWRDGHLVPAQEAGMRVDSSWKARLHPRGFLESLVGEERMDCGDAVSSCSGTNGYSLAFRSEFRSTPDPLCLQRARREGTSAGLRPDAGVGRDEGLARAFPGESVDQVLDRVRRVGREATTPELRSMLLLDLKALCREDPRAVARVLAGLSEGPGGDSPRQIMAMALAASGSLDAEAGLRKLALQAQGSLREAAVESLGFVARPGTDTVQALEDLARARGESSEVRRLACQGLGLLGSSPDASPELRQLAGLKLLQSEPRPGEDPAPWLLAVRNAVPEGGERACLQMYGRGGEAVRLQALQALARYQSQEAREAVRRMATEDASESIRATARALLEASGTQGTVSPGAS